MVQRLAIFLTVATIAWGALAFGGVYPWAYWLLAGLGISAGTAGLIASGKAPQGRFAEKRQRGVSVALIAGLVSVGIVVCLQLLPLPLHVLRILNPNGVELLQRLSPAFAFSPGAHELSVWPPATKIALVLFGSFALLLIGTSNLISAVGGRRIAEIVLIIGVLMAVIGIIQRPLYAGKIYGFWTPQQAGSSPFGPFVNRNHFAGWMLMALPLALGCVCASLAKAMRGVRPGWRDRFLWFSSSEASKLILALAGIAVMAISLVLTMSRSGMASLAAAFAITGWFAFRRLEGRSRKVIATAYLVLLPLLLVAWAGVDTLADRFSEANWHGRSGAWLDAIATFKRHWLTGTGLNTYQMTNLVYQQHDKARAFVSSAHNDYLQLAAEGGVVLVCTIGISILIFVRDVRRRFAEDGESSAYWIRAGAVTSLVAIALQEMVEFSLQIPGNAALFAVVCAIALHRSPYRPAEL